MTFVLKKTLDGHAICARLSKQRNWAPASMYFAIDILRREAWAFAEAEPLQVTMGALFKILKVLLFACCI